MTILFRHQGEFTVHKRVGVEGRSRSTDRTTPLRVHSSGTLKNLGLRGDPPPPGLRSGTKLGLVSLATRLSKFRLASDGSPLASSTTFSTSFTGVPNELQAGFYGNIKVSALVGQYEKNIKCPPKCPEKLEQ